MRLTADADQLITVIAERDDLVALNHRLREAVDKTSDALAVEIKARKEWRDLALYAFHLAQYGETAPGGTETWNEFERRLRKLSEPPE